MKSNYDVEQIFHKMRSAQVTASLATKVKRGEFPGKAPIGYMNNSQTKQIVPDLETWEIIKEALEQYATGKFSIEWISQFLNENLPSIQHGGRKPLTKARVKAILSNPFYRGDFTFRGRVFHGRHKPMLTGEMFDKIQKQLKGGKM